jgi:hypothetical protein
MYNSIRTLCALACFAGLGEGVTAAPAWQEPADGGSGPKFQNLPPMGYANPHQMARELEALAAKSSRMTLQVIGKAATGQPLLMATLVGDSQVPDRPEVLIVANLEGDRPVASEVAMGVIRRMAVDGSPLLDVATVHVLAVANPDGATNALAGGLPWRGAAVDDDRDGRIDEDGPADLDGDGKTLWLRVPSSTGEWHASESDSRCSVKAKDVREHAGAFHLRREGLDADGDRAFTEDGPGGIAVDSNFAHRWKQYAPEAGPYPLSESESRAIVDFLIAHPRVACVLVLDDEDNLAKTPKGDDKVKPNSTEPMKADSSLIAFLGARLKPVEPKETKGEEVAEESDAPAAMGPLDGALQAGADIQDGVEGEADASEKETKRSWTAPRSSEHGAGNFADWAYYQRGAIVLESAVWSPPLDSKTAAGKPLPKEATEEEKLLAWADATYGSGHFQSWTPFQHPDLGSVEIGGFLPLVLTNPPASVLPDLISNYADFVDSLAADLAHIEWSEVRYTALDDQDVFDVRAKLVNRGRFASSSAMGDKNRVPLPIRVSIELPEGAQILVGSSRSSVARLTGFGGFEEYHWIVQVPAGAGNPKLIALSNTAGQARLTLEVK